ncbi:hypothetical protein [Wolbachia endosymbiont (group A) of Nomada goodeniana]|uniref:hypothetical protein n=1 Tax=Wolbachia endosymbiont (group A) of Nomada goodeniana TaxID=3066207 RepID=UPI00333EA618
MTNKKITVVRKDQSGKDRKFDIDLSKLPDEILSALEGVSCTDIQQHTFVSKINKAKKPGGAMPSPRDAREKSINLGEGLDRIYGTKPASNQEDYPEGLSPFDSELQKRKLSARESEWLSWFKSAIVTAKNPIELNKVVDEAIDIGMRMNGRHEGGRSFAEYVILGMHFHKFKKGDQKKIIHKLMLSGAEFDTLLKNKLVGEIYKELQPEVQPQIDKRFQKLREAGENAVQEGTVEEVGMDNDTFYMKFSKGSTVEPAKVLEGTRNLGLNKGWVELGGHIMVRQEVLGEQLVKIQHKQSLANSLEQTTMLHEVTSVIELVGWTMQGTTEVKEWSPEIPEDIEVDMFIAMEDSMKDNVKASYHSLYRDLRPCHVLKWTSSELGRSHAFLLRYVGTSQQRQELAEDAGEVGLIDSTQNVGKPRTRGSDQQYSNWNRDCYANTTEVGITCDIN